MGDKVISDIHIYIYLFIQCESFCHLHLDVTSVLGTHVIFLGSAEISDLGSPKM